jgi:hypothetical protein
MINADNKTNSQIFSVGVMNWRKIDLILRRYDPEDETNVEINCRENKHKFKAGLWEQIKYSLRSIVENICVRVRIKISKHNCAHLWFTVGGYFWDQVGRSLAGSVLTFCYLDTHTENYKCYIRYVRSVVLETINLKLTEVISVDFIVAVHQKVFVAHLHAY